MKQVLSNLVKEEALKLWHQTHFTGYANENKLMDHVFPMNVKSTESAIAIMITTPIVLEGVICDS